MFEINQPQRWYKFSTLRRGTASKQHGGAMSEQLATRKAIAEGRYGPDKILTREDVCGKIPDSSPE